MGKASWANKKIVLLGQSSTFHKYLKEVLKDVAWRVDFFVQSPEEAISVLESRKASLLIIDDSINEPAPNLIRILMRYPITFATPVFVFLLEENKYEKLPLNYMGFTELNFKPLTPADFMTSLTTLVHRWELKPFEMLRKVYFEYLRFNDWDKTELLLLKLQKIKELKYVATPLLSLHYINEKRPKDAELMLLSQIKSAPKSLGSVLTLGLLYMEYSMPHIARKLFASAQNQFDFSRCMLPDLIQADFLLANYNQAIDSLNSMNKRGYLSETVEIMMVRLHCLLGNTVEASNLMENKKGLLLKIEKAWESV